ncbi:MAG TPA: hypothetical protein VFX20_09485 [Steroidobacteraceae bacterium]|nr:hypothetical protein [Steroidobacteraceae bacterium]
MAMTSVVKPSYHSTRARRVVYFTACVALVNFFAFVLIGTYLGGDAINGHITNGAFFLCGHGVCTRVTGSVWHYSYWHALTTIGLVFLAVTETAYFGWRGRSSRA